MKEEDVVARLFGLTKEKHRRILINDNAEELKCDIKAYDKIKSYTKQEHVLKFTPPEADDKSNKS